MESHSDTIDYIDHASRCIIDFQGKLLLMYRKRIIDTVEKEYYVTIWWWREFGENYEETLHRECKEEAWIEIHIKDEIWDFILEERNEFGIVERRISKIFYVFCTSSTYLQTIETNWPEASNYNDQNIYEIHEISRNEIEHINLVPLIIKEMIITYWKLHNYISI